MLFPSESVYTLSIVGFVSSSSISDLGTYISYGFQSLYTEFCARLIFVEPEAALELLLS